jgi:transposase
MKLDNSKARTPSHIWQPHKNQSKKWKKYQTEVPLKRRAWKFSKQDYNAL